MALQSAALAGYQKHTKKTVSYAKYKIGNTWYTTGIESIKVLSGGIVEIAFMIELNSGSGTVNTVQLYNTDNELWWAASESLKLSDVSEGFLYVVQIQIEEVST